jgi:hypothetical protein
MMKMKMKMKMKMTKMKMLMAPKPEQMRRMEFCCLHLKYEHWQNQLFIKPLRDILSHLWPLGLQVEQRRYMEVSC